jgi:hypothetical protein
MSAGKIRKKSKVSKRVRTRFSAKKLTSAAGLIPLQRYWEQLGGEAWINRELDSLKGANSTYSVGLVVTILLLGFLRGIKHFSHLPLLGSDKALRSLWDWVRFPVETTFTRTLDLFGFKGAVRLTDLLQQLRQRVWNRNWIGSVTLDLDSTVQTVYGNQEGASKGYNPTDPGKKSYHPLLAFIAETSEVLLGWLRPGDCHTAKGAVDFLKEGLTRLPKQVWKVTVRADSGFFSGDFLDFLDRTVSGYVIKVKMKGYKQFCEKHARWRQSGTGRWTTTFSVKLNNWSASRTFVAIRILDKYEEDDLFGKRPVYVYLLWVTNLRLSPNKLETFYNQRATCENLISVGKGQLGWNTMRTGSFWTNETLFQVAILAYNVFVWFKRRYLPAGDQGQELETFRNWFIRVAGKVIHTGRRWFIDLGTDYPWKEEWLAIENDQLSTQPF